MFGTQTFGGILLGVVLATTPAASGGGFGAAYFGQYAPATGSPSLLAPAAGGAGFGSCCFGQYARGFIDTPPSPLPGTGGGGLGSGYFGQYWPLLGGNESPAAPARSDGLRAFHPRQYTRAFGYPDDRGVLARAAVGLVTAVGSTPVSCIPSGVAPGISGVGKPRIRAIQNPTVAEMARIVAKLLAGGPP